MFSLLSHVYLAVWALRWAMKLVLIFSLAAGSINYLATSMFMGLSPLCQLPYLSDNTICVLVHSAADSTFLGLRTWHAPQQNESLWGRRTPVTVDARASARTEELTDLRIKIDAIASVIRAGDVHIASEELLASNLSEISHGLKDLSLNMEALRVRSEIVDNRIGAAKGHVQNLLSHHASKIILSSACSLMHRSIRPRSCSSDGRVKTALLFLHQTIRRSVEDLRGNISSVHAIDEGILEHKFQEIRRIRASESRKVVGKRETMVAAWSLFGADRSALAQLNRDQDLLSTLEAVTTEANVYRIGLEGRLEALAKEADEILVMVDWLESGPLSTQEMVSVIFQPLQRLADRLKSLRWSS